MLKNILKALVVTALGVGLAVPSFATSATVTKIDSPYTKDKPFPGFRYTVTSMTSSTIDTVIVGVGALVRPFVGASGVPTIAVTNAFSATAAGDSAWLAIDFGPTASGPWKSNNPMVANTLTGGTPIKSTALVGSTSIGFLAPFWRIRTIGKSTTATATFYWYFPSIGSMSK